MAIDSTARLKYFRYQRTDDPFVRLKKKKESKFFVQPSENLRVRTIEIDSTGKYVEIREKTAGQETKILLRVSLEDYIEARLAAEERKGWESVGYAYEMKALKKGLGDIIKDITDFEIPLPSVGVLSIFGPPKISLKIGGAVQIHGAWRSETTEGVTASRLGNTRNEPDFKQQVQINVNGTIGDKLNITADWNTERTFEYENQLKIKYTGYEDEIIQSIEAGNVSLQTSPLVGGSEALFGIKAQFKMGPFTLTTLASQKKGEVKEVSVSSGSTSQTFSIRAYQYSKNHYFIDSVYADTSAQFNFFKKYYESSGSLIDPRYRITDIEVWKSINVSTIDRSKERFANAYINLDPRVQPDLKYDPSLRVPLTNPIPGQQETGRFLLMTRDVDYTLHPETGFITFNTNINESDIIAVAYRVENDPGTRSDDLFYGEFINSAGTDTFLVLKLVKPKNLQPGGTFAKAWKLQLKNIYPIGGRNVKKEGFEFNIKYEIEGQEPVTEFPTPGGNIRLLNAFALDNLDASGNSQPSGDGVFDFRAGLTIIPETGEIIFPVLQPFGRNLPGTLPDSIAYNQVYDTTETAARQNKLRDKWLMEGKYSGDVSSIYQLGFNVVENSVKVRLNNRELTPGVDYVVDYNIGQLTIRNDAALVPGADLKITYEQNDLFQLASKTLLGARGLFEFSKKTKLGFSVLNLNQQTLSDKVRIGEEPLSNTIYGLDFSTQADLPFLTRLLDNVISTREMSSFTIGGEYAYIDPDPNTKKSNIASDQGKSIAYIDDFEGAKRIIPLGVGYTGWRDLSPPDSLPFLQGLNKSQKMDFKGKSIWYTIAPSDVLVNDIFGDRKRVAKADQQVTVMDYVFLPDTPGTFNYNSNLIDRKKNWGGIMKILSSTANNLVEENIEFIEFWLKINQAPQDAKIYIDLGRISEDVIPNDKLDTEDKDFNDAIDVNGTEDTGLDGIRDPEERSLFGSSKNDPSGDNFFFQNLGSIDPYDYFTINGTEGNAVSTDLGRYPDTEDLNKNGTLDLVNSYFRYEVPLDTNRLTNPFIQGGGFTPEGWYLYRVPLKEASLQIGNPSFSNVEYIRVFVNGVENIFHVRIAEFNLVGNQWEKVIKEDSILSVSTISFEDNPEYTLPPGISQERDRSRPDEEVYRNEQSLNLIINSLPQGEFREAIKYLPRSLDVFNYKEMKLFIHGDKFTGDGSVSTEDTLNPRAEIFFRFGGDTLNYYEYRQPIRPDWNDISISFSELTAIKQRRGDSINVIFKVPVPGRPGHFYIVKGNPTLTAVKFLSVGIFNINDANHIGPVSGQVWINELRVIGADDSPGWAFSVSSSFKFADLMTVNLNLSQTNPYFHKLSDRFGSRVESRNWGISTDLDIMKLLPINFPESSFKLNYSHTESVGKPLYVPGTDIRVDEAVQQLQEAQSDTGKNKIRTNPEDFRAETQTVNVSDTWTLSNIKIKIPTTLWYIRDTFNALSFGFNYNKTFSRSPTVLNNKTWVWNATVNYGLNFSPDYFFEPVKIPVLGTIFALLKDYSNTKVYFTPQNISLNVTARRNRNSNVTRPRGIAPSQEVISRDFMTTRGFTLNWKMTEGGIINLTTNYNVNISSSLLYLETDASGQQRPESEIWKDIFSRVFFGTDYRYQQSIDFRTAPRIPSIWDINKFFSVNASYSASYQWNFDFNQPELGRSAGYSSKSTLGLTLRLKALMDPLFKETEKKEEVEEQKQLKETKLKPKTKRRGRDRDLEAALNLSTGENKNQLPGQLIEEVDSLNVQTTGKKSSLTMALSFLKSVAKTIFFDYENINFNFTNDNSLSKSGIAGQGTGFYNFWGLVFNESNGPSRGFMLGISNNVGRRAPNANLSDVFSQKNNLEFRTSRPLWEGAKIDLNWKVGWSLNKNTTLTSDEFGNVSVTNITSTGNISRSFFTMPPVLFLSVFKSGIKRVSELYNPESENAQENLSAAFIEGFESFPLLSKFGFLSDVAKYIPRPNWRINWDGLEKLFIFKAFAKKVSLDHSYSSNYTEGWKINPDGVQEIQTQKIDYGFQPLVGLNFTFGQLWGGNLTSNFKYSTKTSFDLGVTTKNITETFSREIGITAGYTKQGFEIPLFGVALKNDIEFSFSYSSSQNSVVRYEMNNFTEEGIPQDGTTRTTIEPRIKYTISSKVQLSIFYKRSSVEPEGAARIPPTTTNEAGLDVNITIQ
ncbi:MAG: cell surface protein SprA [Ignavibacteriaceae bacterium]|nr:cell surface protein SprA [Ignavibacteriaceae bacterium]